MSTFSFPVRDLIVTSAVAAEVTVATFIASASNGEVAILKRDGSAASAAGTDAYIVSKDSNGQFKSSDVLKVKQIVSVTKTDPTTIVPAYASWDVSVTNRVAGDIFEGTLRIQEFLSKSIYDEYIAPFYHVFATGDTVDTVTEGLIKSLSFEFSRVQNGSGGNGQYVNFKTGYASVWTTEAAVIAGKAALTNGDIIFVIETGSAYTVLDKTAATFVLIAGTPKTDWSAEIAATTAEYLSDNPWFQFIKLDGATPKIYIIAKSQPTTDMKMQGYDPMFKVGIHVLDKTSGDNILDITVTNVGKAYSAGEGKFIRNLEIFTKGHTGDFYRGMGYPNNFDAVYEVSKTANYYVINVAFYADQKDVNTLSGHPSQKELQIVTTSSGAATTIYNALAALL